MLSKNKIKYIRSLELKKNRKEEGAFVAEGHKLVGELLGYFPCRILLAVRSWLDENPDVKAHEVIEVTQDELSRASLLKTPQDVLAVFGQPQYPMEPEVISRSLCLALDDVQDPGNLGTIIRVADWFGIEHIFCSQGTVDVYNPKTIQATMGAIARVQIHYVDLYNFLCRVRQENPSTPLYGTFLEGKNIYQESLTSHGIIIMGNEGNGIGQKVKELVSHKLFIPNYPEGSATSESLNVAIATAITCAEFRRR
jgi:TrmH family RNA methyltransferase